MKPDNIDPLKNNKSVWLAAGLIAVALLLWWWPYFSKGWFPLSEWGSGLIWGDWLSDKLWFVSNRVIPEWNPNNVLGVNYIGRDPFNNPLSLGNIFKFLIPNVKAEWIFGTFFYLFIMGIGTYYFLLSQKVSKKLAMLGAALIVIYPKWIDDIYHGPGKFVAAYSVVPWLMLRVHNMFQDRPRAVDYLVLGIFGAIIFLGSGAWVSLYLTYLIVPWFLYNIVRYAIRNKGAGTSLFTHNIFGIALSAITAIGLSAYLLFPLLDNLRLSARSLYSPPVGYGLFDLLGLLFPWVARLYSAGIYDFPVQLPGIGAVANLRSYFGILLLPILVYVLMDKEMRKRYRFFWIWPISIFILFSKAGNTLLPIARLFEKSLNAQSSENFLFFSFIFCLNIIIVAGLSAVCEKYLRRKTDILPRAVKWVSNALLIFYIVIIGSWISLWIIVHTNPVFLNKLFSTIFSSGPKGAMIFAGIQLVFYSYFYDVFFFLFLLAFLVRAFILWWFRSELFVKKSFGIYILAALMILDFALVSRIVYPFTSRIDESYSSDLKQNDFINKRVGATERVGAYYPGEKYSYKFRNFAKALEERYGKNIPWDPPAVYRAFKDSNSDGDYFEPLFDPSTTYYPVTVGKQSYSYHESLLPDYFFDYDKAMNEGNKKYYRGSWNSLWDSKSPLIDIAGISYLFWFEPVKDDRLVLADRYPVGDGYIYKNTRALPKAYIASRLEYFKNREDLLARMKEASFNPSTTVTTEDKEMRDLYSSVSKSVSGNVDVLGYEANRILFRVNASSPSILVVTDLFFPYWSARIDGVDAKIYRVNCAFRGVLIGQGDHLVEMRYYNPSFHKGLMVSSCILILVCVFFGMNFVFTRRSKNHN